MLEKKKKNVKELLIVCSWGHHSHQLTIVKVTRLAYCNHLKITRQLMVCLITQARCLRDMRTGQKRTKEKDKGFIHQLIHHLTQ